MWLHLLGGMASCIGGVQWARQRMRPLQLYVLSQLSPSSRGLFKFLWLTQPVAVHLQWWSTNPEPDRGCIVMTTPSQMTLETDACTSWGWGGFIVNGPFTQGEWSMQDRSHHINWLEMMAVWNCLKALKNVVTGKSVLLRSDNTLCYFTWDLFMFEPWADF